ncbi:hypothetical protein [Gracilibacillus sp. Marseille-QA3620]
MTMICPEGYIEMQNNKSYIDLIEERESLIRKIREFEENISSTDDFMISLSPSPEVVYQMNLLYLGKLCELIAEVYNRENV